MAGVPYRGPVRVVREAMVREEVEAQEAPPVLGLAPARGEAARATSRGPVEEKTPGGSSRMGRLFSYRAKGQVFPRRFVPAQARESPLGGSSRLAKSWGSTRSRHGSIWNAARFPKATRTWYGATSRSWSDRREPRIVTSREEGALFFGDIPDDTGGGGAARKPSRRQRG